MAVVTVTCNSQTRLLALPKTWADLQTRVAKKCGGQGTLWAMRQGQRVDLCSEDEWELFRLEGITNLNYDLQSDPPPPPPYVPALEPTPAPALLSLVDRLKASPTQQTRLALLAEALEVKATDILPCLRLFPDYSEQVRALKLLLRPIYGLHLDGKLACQLARQFRREAEHLLTLWEGVTISCSVTDMLEIESLLKYGDTLRSLPKHHKVSKASVEEVFAIVNFSSRASDCLHMLQRLKLPYLCETDVNTILDARFSTAKAMRKQARKLLMGL